MGTGTMKQRIAEVSRRILGPSPQDIIDQIAEDQREFHEELRARLTRRDAEEIHLEDQREAELEGSQFGMGA